MNLNRNPHLTGSAPRETPPDNGRRTAATATAWLADYALPLWLSEGYDRQSASFIEALDMDGKALHAVPRRVMVQARQIFVACIAATNRWYPGAADIAVDACGSMITRYASDGRPGWAFQCNATGAVCDGVRDLYSQAFVLLALASVAGVTGDKRYLDLADETLSFLYTSMADPAGGFISREGNPAGARQQNPHMHLFEALLALHVQDGSRGYAERAKLILQLFEDRFFDAGKRVLHETMDHRWNPLNDDLSFEPGHHFEWAWLLWQYSSCSNVELKTTVDILIASGLTARRADSLFLDNYSATHQNKSGPTRLWPHTEAMKAAATPPGSQAWPAGVSESWFLLSSNFLQSRVRGGWIDRLDGNGLPAAKVMPASSLYHIVCAVDYVNQQLYRPKDNARSLG